MLRVSVRVEAMIMPNLKVARTAVRNRKVKVESQYGLLDPKWMVDWGAASNSLQVSVWACNRGSWDSTLVDSMVGDRLGVLERDEIHR